MSYSSKDEFGRYGRLRVTGGGSTPSGVYIRSIQFLSETVISASTDEPLNPNGDTDINGTWPAGSSCYGMIKDVTFDSGDAVCYFAEKE